jgi:hypothetical protein
LAKSYLRTLLDRLITLDEFLRLDVLTIDNVSWVLTTNGRSNESRTLTNNPDVTNVLMPREQFSKPQISLESIYAATPQSFRLTMWTETLRRRFVAILSSRRRRWDLSLYELRII